MTSSNRVRVATVREVTLGTTPNTPRMRIARITGESLAYNQEFLTSDEIRSDRMNNDPALVMQNSGGGINFELSYPKNDTPLSDFLRSAMFSTWTNTPERDNDGTADSVITDIGTTANTITFTTGAAFVLGHLIQTTGFANAANNKIMKVTTGGATSLVSTGASFTAETAPPAAARVKVVGFQGASGDITATATGLGSTTLDFTTLGLSVGMTIKIGGTAAGDKFATAACAGFARITAIAATALTLDNLPAGWTTDTGTGKTIKVWIGDVIANGTTKTSLTIERGFLGQTTPTYITNRGMVAGQLNVSISAKDKIKGSVTFNGTGGGKSTTAGGASYDAETTNPIMTANANVARFTEAGATVVGPNFVKSLDFTINNNLRMLEDISSNAPVGINEGECSVTGKADAYFGDDSFLTKFYGNTATSFLQVVEKNNQAVSFNFPRVTFTGGGNPSAGGKNQDVMQSFDWTASKAQDGTGAQVIITRLECTAG